MTSLEKLYEAGNVLSAAGKGPRLKGLTEEYRTILKGVKSPDPLAKRLSSQFIARFFQHFPDLDNEALDAMLDLCEDEDINIRKQAIKDLPSLCRELKQHLPKIVDVLTQLLMSEDKTEILVIEASIMNLFRRDAKGTLIGLFSQIKTGGDVVRERAIRFLGNKMKIEQSLLNKEAEVTLLREVKASLEECTAEEFHLFMEMLSRTSIPKTVSGQAQLLEIAASMAELEQPFQASDSTKVDKFVQCSKAAVDYFSAQNKSTKFFKYLCLQVLPNLHAITDMDDQTAVLKLLGESSMYTSEFEEHLQATRNVYQKLLDYMPLPPEDAIEAAEVSASAGEAGNEVSFELTKVECLLTAFHVVARENPSFLTEDQERSKDFKARLQYFSRGVQAYNKKLNEFVSKKLPSELKKEENQSKVIALECTKNLQTLIKDLFHSPPIFKAKIVVSWKRDATKKNNQGSVAGGKRQAITFNEDTTAKKSKSTSANGNSRGGSSYSGNGVYKPPTGKFSKGVDGYKEGRRGYGGRGRGRGRRWQRGRGGKFY